MATAVWRGQLTFGLLSFPVKLYAAARRETISFRQLIKKEDPELAALPPSAVPRARSGKSIEVKESSTTAPMAEPVYTEQDRVTHAPMTQTISRVEAAVPVVKGYEFEKDHFVAVDPDEIKKLARSTSRDIEVTEFVHWNEIDPVFLDASYFVTPDPSGEKPYSLLYAAMKKTGFAAMAQIAMHGREQVLVLRLGTKGLVAHTMYYYPEVRREEEFPAAIDNLNPKELDLAAKLIGHLAAPFQPEQYVDTYKARLQALVDEKVNRVSTQAEEPAAIPAARKPPVDILDALKRSLEKAAERKVPQTVTHSKRKSA